MRVQLVEDAVGEWWTSPLATQLSSRTVVGAISSTGEILACEFDTLNREQSRVVVGQTNVDDHNCPALWAVDGERMIICWNNHGRETRLYFKVSDSSGTVQSFVTAPEQIYNTDAGVSYSQIHRIDHLSDSSQNTFWCFFRYGTYSWRYVPFSVSKSSGTITFGEEVPIVQAVSPRQCYLTTASNHGSPQIIRAAWGYNPAQPVHAIRYIEINTVTGNITSPTNPEFYANVSGTNLPILEDSLNGLIPESESGWSRRLFYIRPGPASPAVAYADWDLNTPNEAVYKVMSQQDDGSWSVTEYGTAGERVGYIAEANYIPGMSFPDPAVDNTVAVAYRHQDQSSTVSVFRADGFVESKAYTGNSYLMRPTFPVNQSRDLVVSALTYYDSFVNYKAYTWYIGQQTSDVRLHDGTPVILVD